jgi:hypothetical protein
VSLLDTAAIDGNISPTVAAAPSHHAAAATRSPNSGSTGPSGFAPPVKTAVQVASLADIAPFFNRSEPEGSLPEIPADEIESLNAAFALRTTQKFTSGRVEIDHAKTYRKQQFMKLCKEVFKVPLWLKDVLFRKIALASGLNDSQPLSYTHVKKFHDASFGRLTPNRRLFELLKQNPRMNHLTVDDFTHMTRYLVETLRARIPQTARVPRVLLQDSCDSNCLYA